MERAVKARKAAVAAVDETNRVFVPDFKCRTIKPIGPRKRGQFFAPGEGARFIRDDMRVHPGAVTVAAIAASAVTAKGLPPEMLKPVGRMLCAALKAMAKSGGASQTGAGKAANWAVRATD
jgi:hypothetical protein